MWTSEESMTEYKKLTDEELIRRLRMGETGIIDYLMEKYKNLVRKEANAMYLLGGETDDLIQEGMIGLSKLSRIMMWIRKLRSSVLQDCV